MPNYQYFLIHVSTEMYFHHMHVINTWRHKGYEDKKSFCLLNATL